MSTATEDTAVAWRYRLRPDARVVLDSSPPQLVTTNAVLPLTSPVHLQVVRDLAAGPRDELELMSAVLAEYGAGAAFRLQLLVQRLHRDGWLEYGLHGAGRNLALLRPLGHLPGPSELPGLAGSGPVRLSRFTLIHRVGGALQAESPRSTHAVVLLDPAAVALATALNRPLDAGSAAVSAGLPMQVAAAVLGVLDHAGLLDDGTEDEQPQLAQWSLPDLLLHATSRAGRRAEGYGASFRLADRFPPLPALAPRREGVSVALPRPDLDAAAAADAPLTSVLENRRSIRRHDDTAPITVARLGELLYRVARTRHVHPIENHEVADRPYPAGGALHELEIYPLVTACDGLDPGLWHYASGDHALEQVSPPSSATYALMAEARFAGVMDADPQVVLLISARFGRVMWKYESVAYAIVLKDVGVLYQTLYLVATAMGLAACGLGGGNSDRFADATGLDYYAETTVGEFLVGSRVPDGEPA